MSTRRVRRRWLIASISCRNAQRLARAEFRGPGRQGPDVLGQAPAAETQPRAQPRPADPRIAAERVGEAEHVRAGHLADLGHRVDEGDLGGEERVRGDLDHLGGGRVGDQERDPRRQRLRIDLAERGLRAAGPDAGDDPVRPQGVGDGVAFPEELRVPGQFRARPGRCDDREPLAVGRRRAGRHRGLPDDEARPPQQRGQPGEARLELGEVRAGGPGALRGSHADEVHVAELRGGRVGGGETEPSGPQPFAQQRLQAGLVERQCPGLQGPGPRRVDVHAEHLEAERGQAGGVRRAQVPGPEDGQPWPPAHGACPISGTPIFGSPISGTAAGLATDGGSGNGGSTCGRGPGPGQHSRMAMYSR